jgi:hypothetical protein
MEEWREMAKQNIAEPLANVAEALGSVGTELAGAISGLIEQAKGVYKSGKYYTILEEEQEYILIIDGKEKKRYPRIRNLDTQERFEEMLRIEAEINKLRPIKTRPQLLASFYALFVDSDKKAEYLTVLQNEHINKVATIMTKKFTDDFQDRITGDVRYALEQFIFNLPNYKNNLPNGISVSALMLLDIINHKADQEGRAHTITLKEYMQLRGLSDRTSAREKLNYDLNILFSMKFTCPIRQRNVDINLFTLKAEVHNGKAEILLSDIYYMVLTNPYGTNKKQFMSLPAEAFLINISNNPNSYYYIRHISKFKHINLKSDNHRNGNRISVKSIVESNPNFMNYKEKKGHKNFSAWILEPFERDMSIFKSFSWHYDQEEPPRNFEEFYNAYVIITWNNYPIEEKKKLTEQRQKHKKKQSKNN